MDRRTRIWSIRFLAFCGVYFILLRSGYAGDAASAILEGLNRLGGAYAFVAAPFLAAFGLSRIVSKQGAFVPTLVGGAILAFLCLTGNALALEITLVGGLATLGAMLSWLIAALALLSLFNAGTLAGAGGAASLGAFGDVVAAITGQSAAANIAIVVCAVLIPIFAPKLADWMA